MGVYIKGLEMPQCCGDCHVGFCKQIGCDKYIGFDNYATSRHPDCPLDDVPPHGRLIDADELKTKYFCGENVEHDKIRVTVDNVLHFIDNAPTVIPADKDGEI